MSQHVRMDAEIQAGSGAQASDQDAKASGCERRAALAYEDEWRRRILLALQPAQCAPALRECRARHHPQNWCCVKSSLHETSAATLALFFYCLANISFII